MLIFAIMLQKENTELQAQKVKKLSSWSMGLSLLCAIHCMATPVFVAAVSLMGLSFLADPFWEAAILGGSALIALLALVTSYPDHQKILPFVIFGGGVLVVAVGLLFHIHWIISTGSMMSAVALLVNWRLKKRVVATCC